MMKHSSDLKKTSGYTLIEVCVVLLILGLLVAPLGLAYSLYKKEQILEKTEISLARVTSAIGAYRNMMGYYPCPASLTAVRGDVNYGHQTNCMDEGEVAVGTCEDGICAKNAPRTVTLSDGSVITPRVRIGAIPFRQLGLDEKYAYDGYGRRLTYAVTERLTGLNTFNQDHGGIEIIDGQATAHSVLDVPGSAHFIVVMYGDNGTGAYTAGGTPLGSCPAEPALERENCLATRADNGSAVFRQVERRDQNDAAGHYDDRVVFFARGGSTQWVKQDGGVGPMNRNIFAKRLDPGANFGVSITGNMSENRVSGAARSRNELRTDRAEDLTIPPNSTWAEVIAGDATAGTGGIECSNPNEFLVGIADNQPVCSTEVFTLCEETGAGYEVVTGITADGQLICEQITPPADCPTVTVPVCNETVTLLGGPHGTIRTITAGASVQASAICNNGNWEQYGAITGECTCWDHDTTYEYDCDPYWWEGHRLFHSQRVCPAPGTTEIIEDTCQCRESPVQTWVEPCLSGYTGAGTTHYFRYTCSPEVIGGSVPWWSSTEYLYAENDCSCTESVRTRRQDCSAGLTGDIWQEKRFICTATGGYEEPTWRTISNTCHCDPARYRTVRRPDCPAGEQGEVTYRQYAQCPGGGWSPDLVEVSRTCAQIPPVQCTWKQPPGSGEVESTARGARIGTDCDCGTSGRCFNPLVAGVDYQNFVGCECN